MGALRFSRWFLVIALLLFAMGVFAQASPDVRLYPASGPPTGKIVVKGVGFLAHEMVDVYFDVTDLSLAVADATGNFCCTLNVPKKALPGVHWVTAGGRQSGLAAQRRFKVRTNWSQFGYGPGHRGFNPYENVISNSNVGRLVEIRRYTRDNYVGGIPAVANGMVYVRSSDDVGSNQGKLYALDARTGAVKWSYTTGGAISSSPAVACGRVYVGSYDDKVHAVDAATGAFKWSFTTGGNVTSSPAVANRIVYVHSADGKLYALDALSGALKWSFSTGGDTVSSPATDHGMVYAASSTGLYALDAISGALKWSLSFSGSYLLPSSPSPAVGYGMVYLPLASVGLGECYLYAYDAYTGKLRWGYKLYEETFATPAVAYGTVFLAGCGFSEDYLYAVDARTGMKKWEYNIGRQQLASPAVANGVVYTGGCSWPPNAGRLFALDASSGSLKWYYTHGDPVTMEPPLFNFVVVADGVVYTGGATRSIYCFGLGDSQSMLQTPVPRPDPTTLVPDDHLRPQGQ